MAKKICSTILILFYAFIVSGKQEEIESIIEDIHAQVCQVAGLYGKACPELKQSYLFEAKQGVVLKHSKDKAWIIYSLDAILSLNEKVDSDDYVLKKYLAYIIGHEVSHYLHDDYKFKMRHEYNDIYNHKKESLVAEIKDSEISADELGIILARLAGFIYKEDEIKPMIHKIIESFGNESLIKLKDRVNILQARLNNGNAIADLIELGNMSLICGNFEEAGRIYSGARALSPKMTFHALDFNYLLSQALPYFSDSLMYPFQIYEVQKLTSTAISRGGAYENKKDALTRINNRMKKIQPYPELDELLFGPSANKYVLNRVCLLIENEEFDEVNYLLGRLKKYDPDNLIVSELEALKYFKENDYDNCLLVLKRKGINNIRSNRLKDIIQGNFRPNNGFKSEYSYDQLKIELIDTCEFLFNIPQNQSSEFLEYVCNNPVCGSLEGNEKLYKKSLNNGNLYYYKFEDWDIDFRLESTLLVTSKDFCNSLGMELEIGQLLPDSLKQLASCAFTIFSSDKRIHAVYSFKDFYQNRKNHISLIIICKNDRIQKIKLLRNRNVY